MLGPPIRTIVVALAAGISVAAGSLAGAGEHCDATVSEGESIQAAIDAAEPGDTICLAAGTYAETLVVTTNGLALEGAGQGETFLQGEASGSDATLGVDGVDGFGVRDLTVEQSRGHAIDVLGGSDVLIEDVTIRDFQDDVGPPPVGEGNTWAEAIRLENVDGATVRNVDLSQNDGFLGVNCGTGPDSTPGDPEPGSACVIEDSQLTASWSAVNVAGTSTVTITGSAVLNAGGRGIHVSATWGEPVSVEAHSNAVEGNAIGVNNTAALTVDARFNWWGDSSGPSGEGPGDGDSVSVNVDFDPWCTIEVPDCQPPSGGPAPDPDPEPVIESTGAAATEVVPLVVTVFSPMGGPVDIDVVETVSDPPPGWVFADLKAIIEAPDATPEDPIIIEFRLHDSQLEEGQDHSAVAVLRDGEFVAPCGDPDAGVADPDPCVQTRESEDDEVVITVLTSRASTWHLAVREVRDPAPCPPATFPDVDPDSVHAEAIDCAAFHGIAQGFADGTYGPALPVRRDQMASFIARTLEVAGHALPAADHEFGDIDGNVHADAVGRLAAARIVHGTSATTYSPAEPVRRDQIASFLVRALEWTLDSELTATGGPHFADTAGNTHEGAIDVAFEWGLTAGRTTETYGPADPVRRDQMATFLIRLFDRLQ